MNRQPEVHETHLSESGVAILLDENGDKIDLVRPQYLAPYNDTIGWMPSGGLEFFVDFETSNDVLTDFSKLPYVSLEYDLYDWRRSLSTLHLRGWRTV